MMTDSTLFTEVSSTLNNSKLEQRGLQRLHNITWRNKVTGIADASLGTGLLLWASVCGLLSWAGLPHLTSMTVRAGSVKAQLRSLLFLILLLAFISTLYKDSEQTDSVCMNNAQCFQVQRRSLILHSCKMELHQDLFTMFCLHQRLRAYVGKSFLLSLLIFGNYFLSTLSILKSSPLPN